MELLERGDFLRALRDCPPGRVILVTGEAGIGKTSLVKEFCNSVQNSALWGSCDVMQTPRLLGPLRDMARLAGGELAEALAGDSEGHETFATFLDLVADRDLIAEIG
jgi:predicted ATPase